MVVKGALAPLPCKHNWESSECLLKITRRKQALIPGECGIEVVHHILRKHVRVSGRE